MAQAATSVAVAVTLILNLTIETGTASQYAPGVMEKVMANHKAGKTAFSLPDPLPEVEGYAAALD